MSNRFEVERSENNYNLFKDALKEYNIPEYGSKISWEGYQGREEVPGWGDRPDDYYNYDTSGYNESVDYAKFFEEYLDDMGLSVQQLTDKQFEDYFLDWAYDNVIIGSWAERTTFGELVSEHGGDRDFWWETETPSWQEEEETESTDFNFTERKSKKIALSKMKEAADDYEETLNIYAASLADELNDFKKAWKKENPQNWRDALSNCSAIWEAEDNLRAVADYPVMSSFENTNELWENEESGAYVMGEPNVRICFIKYIFEKSIDVVNLSNRELLDEFFNWAGDYCLMELSGDLWGHKKYISWDEYLNGFTPDWIFKED